MGQKQQTEGLIMDKRLKKNTSAGRENRGVNDLDRGPIEDSLVSSDERRKMFRSEWMQEALPNPPAIPGFHLCWLSTTNQYDPIHKRVRLGYTPVKAEDVKPGDIAIFEDDEGNIQHSATVTKASKKEKKVRLTSKDDRNPTQRNQSINKIKKTNPAYKIFAGYYRKNANKKIDVEVSNEGFKGNAGDDDGEEIKKILGEVKKND
jgi:hypothetical protein